MTVALASDCNPGSSFTSSMPLMVALAVREMGMTTAEAVWAATAGGARALRRSDIGAIAPGMRADLVLLDAPSRTHLAYRPGVPLVARVWKDGVAACVTRVAPSDASARGVERPGSGVDRGRDIPVVDRPSVKVATAHVGMCAISPDSCPASTVMPGSCATTMTEPTPLSAAARSSCDAGAP